MSGMVSKIKYAMSLRTPQEEALSYLDAISTHCDYKRDDKATVEAAASKYSENNRKVRTKFDLPVFLLRHGHRHRQDAPDGSLHLLSV